MDRANRSEWSRGCAQVVCDGEDEEDEGGVRHQRVEARRPCVHRAASLARLTRFVNTTSFRVSRPAAMQQAPQPAPVTDPTAAARSRRRKGTVLRC